MNPGVMRNIAQALSQNPPGRGGMMAGPQPPAGMANLTARPPPGSGPGGMMSNPGPASMAFPSGPAPRPQGVMQSFPRPRMAQQRF